MTCERDPHARAKSARCPRCHKVPPLRRLDPLGPGRISIECRCGTRFTARLEDLKVGGPGDAEGTGQGASPATRGAGGEGGENLPRSKP